MKLMNKKRPVYLVGARGSGKTTIGMRLAFLIDMTFFDLDHYLCHKEGKSIKNIVDKDGWGRFREMEAQCLREVTQKAHGCNAIIATGGGIVLSGENREFLKNNGLVFWLRAGDTTLCERLARNPVASQRPALTAESPENEIRRVLVEREALYQECAHHIIDAEKNHDQVCQSIKDILLKMNSGRY